MPFHVSETGKARRTETASLSYSSTRGYRCGSARCRAPPASVCPSPPRHCPGLRAPHSGSPLAAAPLVVAVGRLRWVVGGVGWPVAGVTAAVVRRVRASARRPPRSPVRALPVLHRPLRPPPGGVGWGGAGALAPLARLVLCVRHRYGQLQRSRAIRHPLGPTAGRHAPRLPQVAGCCRAGGENVQLVTHGEN